MSVVFTDAFTVASDIDLASYPSGDPDYAYNKGASGLNVDAGNDRVECTVVDSSRFARIIDAAVPTGDQEITASVNDLATDASGSAAVRCATAGTVDLYKGDLNNTGAAEVELYRFDNGTATLLASADRGLSAGSHTMRLKATGTGATVSLELQINATAVLTYDDTSASRKTSGPPGVGGYTADGTLVWVDDVSVDDLAAGGAASVVSPRLLALLGVGA